MGTAEDTVRTKVAIVADSRRSMGFIHAIARLSGFSKDEVEEFTSCVSLFQKLEARQRFDLYILVYNQKDNVKSNHLQLLRFLHPEAKIVVISDVLDPYAANRFTTYGASMFFELVADVDVIVSYIRQLMIRELA